MSSERVSIRKYAKMIGVSDTTVRKAIKAEKIVKGYGTDEDGNPYIIPDIANEEWSVNYDPSYQRVTKSGDIPVYSNEPVYKAPAEKRSAAPKAVTPVQDNEPAKTGMSIADVKRMKEIARTKLLDLEFKQKSGQLVDKDVVYKSLFDAGQQIKIKMQALPDNVIDAVLSAKTRNEAILILNEAIETALTSLSDVHRKGIGEKK